MPDETTTTAELSLGETMVRINFNTSEDTEVASIKAAAAVLINRIQRVVHLDPAAVKRAQNKVQEASMLAVFAATTNK